MRYLVAMLMFFQFNLFADRGDPLKLFGIENIRKASRKEIRQKILAIGATKPLFLSTSDYFFVSEVDIYFKELEVVFDDKDRFVK